MNKEGYITNRSTGTRSSYAWFLFASANASTITSTSACSTPNDDDSSTDKSAHSDDADKSPAVEKFVCEPRSSEAPTAFSDGCADPISVPDRTGKDSGFVCCADGSINREQKKTLSGFKDDDCSSDEDCGHKTDYLCLPGTLIDKSHPNTCTFSLCSQNDDCESGECGMLDTQGPLCKSFYLDSYCRTTMDTCRVNSDCNMGYFCGVRKILPENESMDIIYFWECREEIECLD